MAYATDAIPGYFGPRSCKSNAHQMAALNGKPHPHFPRSINSANKMEPRN
jgi:hypothetical protein